MSSPRGAPQYSVLILGTTQAGKSTLIEHIKNYANQSYSIDQSLLGNGSLSKTESTRPIYVKSNLPAYEVYRRDTGEAIDLDDLPSKFDDEEDYYDVLFSREQDLGLRQASQDPSNPSDSIEFRFLDSLGLKNADENDSNHAAIIIDKLIHIQTFNLIVITESYKNLLTQEQQLEFEWFAKVFKGLHSRIMFLHTHVDYTNLHPTNSAHRLNMKMKNKALSKLFRRHDNEVPFDENNFEEYPSLTIDLVSKKRPVINCLIRNTIREILKMAIRPAVLFDTSIQNIERIRAIPYPTQLTDEQLKQAKARLQADADKFEEEQAEVQVVDQAEVIVEEEVQAEIPVKEALSGNSDEEVYDSLLVEKSTGITYVTQLLFDKVQKYYVYVRWGKTDYKLDGPHDTIEVAKEAFQVTYKEKFGVEWSTRETTVSDQWTYEVKTYETFEEIEYVEEVIEEEEAQIIIQQEREIIVSEDVTVSEETTTTTTTEEISVEHVAETTEEKVTEDIIETGSTKPAVTKESSWLKKAVGGVAAIGVGAVAVTAGAVVAGAGAVKSGAHHVSSGVHQVASGAGSAAAGALEKVDGVWKRTVKVLITRKAHVDKVAPIAETLRHGNMMVGGGSGSRGEESSASSSVLLLGKTQAGKSTFIEFVKNYADQKYTVDESLLGTRYKSKTQKPVQFAVETDLLAYEVIDATGTRIDIGTLGDQYQDPDDYFDALRDRTTTLKSVTHDLASSPLPRDVKIDFLDTPGVEDTNGRDAKHADSIIDAMTKMKSFNLIIIIVNCEDTASKALQLAFNYYSEVIHTFQGHHSNVVFLYTHVEYEKCHHSNADHLSVMKSRHKAFSQLFRCQGPYSLEVISKAVVEPFPMYNIDFNKRQRPITQCMRLMTLREILTRAVNSPAVALDTSESNLQRIRAITHPDKLNQAQRKRILEIRCANMEQGQGSQDCNDAPVVVYECARSLEVNSRGASDEDRATDLFIRGRDDEYTDYFPETTPDCSSSGEEDDDHSD
ncbi:hypothetical protein CPB97_009697 [Podila verticillata]|nr:hypothetical protein CPB97_009697 [Podila verticillata]